jgi:hypothetical protein
MEVTPVTFGTFRTVFLHNEASLVSIPRLIRDFSCRRSLHSRAATIFMIMALVFILLFPTFASAMTGYSAGVEAYVQNLDGSYVSLSDFPQPGNDTTYYETYLQEHGICQAQKVCKHSSPTCGHLLRSSPC